MSSLNCTLVEIPSASEGNPHPTPCDLLPWADPYISRLLAKHRLQAALDDSLSYLGLSGQASRFASTSGRWDS